MQINSEVKTIFSVKYLFQLPLRSTLTNLTGGGVKARLFGTQSRNKQNMGVMFLRSPKHFKTGKQIIFFYNNKLILEKKFEANTCGLLNISQNTTLFNFFKNYGPNLYTKEIHLSRLTIKMSTFIKFMAGVIFIQLIGKAVAFSFVFWGLTFAGKILYTNKYFNYKLNFYECGFKNLTKKKISYEINYIMLVLFLLIYDGEFLILVPYAFNTNLMSIEITICLLFFFA